MVRRSGFLILLVFVAMVGCGGKKPKYTAEQLEKMPLAQRQGLPDVSGGFVLNIAGEPITEEEVIGPVFNQLGALAQSSDFERFKTLVSPAVSNVLTAKISEAVLYSRAKEEFGENAADQLDQAARAEVRKFVAGFGGDYAKAQQALKQMGLDWESFEQFQKKRIMSQSYIAEQMPKDEMVTYSELMAMYEGVKEQLYSSTSSIQFQLIDIQPAKMTAADADKSSREQAKALAEELIRRIRAGEDFGELAKRYSNGHMREQGGVWQKLNPESLAKPYDILAAEAAKAKTGQVVGPIEADEHIFIMKVLEYKRKGVEPFEDVQNELKARIKFERQRKVIDELNAKLAEQASVEDTKEFVDYCVAKIYRMANR